MQSSDFDPQLQFQPQPPSFFSLKLPHGRSLVQTALLTFFAYLLGILTVTAVFIVFERLTGYVSDAGFGAIIILFILPQAIAILALFPAIIYSALLLRLPQEGKQSKILAMISAAIIICLVTWLGGTYVYMKWIEPLTPAYRFDRSLEQLQAQMDMYMSREDFHYYPARESEWLTFRDPTWTFTLRYPPLWRYKVEQQEGMSNYSISFFYKDLPDVIGSYEKYGSDILSIDVFPDFPDYEYYVAYLQDQSSQTYDLPYQNIYIKELGGRDVINTRAGEEYFFVRLTNGTVFRFRGNGYHYDVIDSAQLTQGEKDLIELVLYTLEGEIEDLPTVIPARSRTSGRSVVTPRQSLPGWKMYNDLANRIQLRYISDWIYEKTELSAGSYRLVFHPLLTAEHTRMQYTEGSERLVVEYLTNQNLFRQIEFEPDHRRLSIPIDDDIQQITKYGLFETGTVWGFCTSAGYLLPLVGNRTLVVRPYVSIDMRCPEKRLEKYLETITVDMDGFG